MQRYPSTPRIEDRTSMDHRWQLGVRISIDCWLCDESARVVDRASDGTSPRQQTAIDCETRSRRSHSRTPAAAGGGFEDLRLLEE